jgi:hypothetical protein
MMTDYIFLMHKDAIADVADDWEVYIEKLQQGGYFQGGSTIGPGECFRKNGTVPQISSHLTGFIRVEADSLVHAKSLLTGNPVFEAGGTVEIRELLRDD